MHFQIRQLLIFAAMLIATVASAQNDQWQLKVSDNNRYIVHADGSPFFWLGNTSWLMPHRLNREEVHYYLTREKAAGYNVEQIQLINAIPTFNIYGQQANDETFECEKFCIDGVYDFWDHLDYIINEAAHNGIYIAIDCVWGSQIKAMDVDKARKLGAFLANRYKNFPNIIWLIGGDIRGDKGTESWDALARAIREIDSKHLMTFHPRGRTTSAWWFNDREWLDFNMFQSGHRRYGQRNGDGDYTIAENTEEDNWRYVGMSLKDGKLTHPIIDGEPSYEDIPQGLHDFSAPRWQACDVRRYAYWAVFGGCFGHTYGHNSIMQMIRPGLLASFGAEKPWWDALNDPGQNQMKYLKALMLALPFTERVADQSVISGNEGERYDRLCATRGNDYLMVYNYSGRTMDIDLSKVKGKQKNVWIFNPSDGSLNYLGKYENKTTQFAPDGGYLNANADRVLIAIDAQKDYIPTNAANIMEVNKNSSK